MNEVSPGISPFPFMLESPGLWLASERVRDGLWVWYRVKYFHGIMNFGACSKYVGGPVLMHGVWKAGNLIDAGCSMGDVCHKCGWVWVIDGKTNPSEKTKNLKIEKLKWQ